VPTDWDDTRGVNGEVGRYATIARKDRRSEDWYLGAVTDETARELSVSLDFLSPGKTYIAQIYRDGENADYKGDRFSFVRETREVTREDTLTLRLAPGGGQAIRFMAKR
jgi:alpha-glucosidase